MRRLGPLVAAAMLLPFAAGCASSDALRRLGEESRATQERLAELSRSTQELRRELAGVRSQLEALRQESEAARREDGARARETFDGLANKIAASEKRIESVAGAVRGVEMSVGGLVDQLARLEAVSAASSARQSSRTARPGVRPPPAAAGAEELFARGMESFKAGELAQAILEFEDVVSRHPAHPLAGVAQFWIGEAYFGAHDYQHATVEYRKAVEMAPKGEKTPEALYKLGLAYRALRRPDRAREVWAELLGDFPQSEAAKRARAGMREGSRSGRSTPPVDR